MNNPREPFDRLFDKFNDLFFRAAHCEGFEFNPNSGPNIIRALRTESQGIKKGVFIELKDHWMQSDLSNPNITLNYGVWFSPTQEAFPFYLLIKSFYDGKLNELKNVEELLFKAIAEVKEVTSDTVIRNGKLFENSKP